MRHRAGKISLTQSYVPERCAVDGQSCRTRQIYCLESDSLVRPPAHALAMRRERSLTLAMKSQALRALDGGFEVLGQAAIAVEISRDSALDDPSPWQRLEVLGGIRS